MTFRIRLFKKVNLAETDGMRLVRVVHNSTVQELKFVSGVTRKFEEQEVD